jgi:arginase
MYGQAAQPARKVDLIGVASGLGGADAMCAEAPARLAAGGLDAQLRSAGIDAAWMGTLAPRRKGDGLHGAVARLCGELATVVAESVRGGHLPCVIGGDHSCAIGTWSGVAAAFRRRGALGLIWIDAHMDSHTPGTSPSGRAHGMPLAALLGQGDRSLVGLGAGLLRPRHVCLVGVRSYETEEAALLEKLGVRVFGIGEIERRGLARVMEDALQIVNEDTAGYGITLDMDALDPLEVPAVATPSPAGIRGAELREIFARIGGDPWLAAFELVEYCPRLDRDGRSERLIRSLLCAALGGSGEDSQVFADAVH